MTNLWTSPLELSAVPVALLVPGYIFDKVFRLIFPRSQQSPRDQVILYFVASGFFVAIASFIGGTLRGSRFFGADFDSGFVLFAILLGLIGGILAGTLLCGTGLLLERNPKRLGQLRRLFARLRFSSAWDFAAGKELEVTVLVETKSGQRIYGVYGVGSYASEWREDGDLYLSKKLTEGVDGQSLVADPDTRGVWIAARDIISITFCNFAVMDSSEV